MKSVYILIFLVLTITDIKSQNSEFKINNLSEEQYRKYFPLDLQDIRQIPTNDVVCILPTNEKNKKLQKEVNKYYRQTFIDKLYFGVPSQHSRVITDKEALKQDLSNVNIRSFGTISGNLWTQWFLSKSKDFPIKIYKDSVVTDTVYRGSNYIVSAIWFNPFNYRHSVIVTVPQSIENVKFPEGREHSQYCIFQDQKVVKGSHYNLLKGSGISSSKNISSSFLYSSNHWNDHFDSIYKRLYRYPTQQQLKSCLISENEIPYETIELSDKIEISDMLKDIEWLKPVAKKFKIVALGENHHFIYNSLFASKILFTLNSYSYFPLLILELPYSYAGYINYYILLENDSLANNFRNNALKRLESTKLLFYDALRSWNKSHPDKKIHVGCSDLEQDFLRTIYTILNPYLKKVDPNAQLTPKPDSVQVYLERAEKLLKRAKMINLVGDYNFQTIDYMETVFENLKSSIPIKMDPKTFSDHTERFRVMIRNVTDKKFLGKEIVKNRTMFYGGAEHFRTINSSLVNNTEGYYLAHQFSPTKGKVYSIRLKTLACSIRDSIRHIDPRLRINLEKTLVDLYYQGKIKLMEPVMDNYITEIDEYFYKISYKYPNKAFRIEKINIEGLYKLDYEGFNRYNILSNVRDLSDFNISIIIPFAPIGDN